MLSGAAAPRSGRALPPPSLRLDRTCGLPAPILRNCRALGYRRPTPIQSVAWPLIMGGHAVVGIAPTGSGKTAAFLIPAILHAVANCADNDAGPTVLVLAPTRELATQIDAQVPQLAPPEAGLRSVLIIGGVPKWPQEEACDPDPSTGDAHYDSYRGPPPIIVATPGRLMDMVRRRIMCYHRITPFIHPL